MEVTSATARSAAELVAGMTGVAPRLLSTGRSSSAWIVEAGSGPLVVRVPIRESGRAVSYRSEARIGRLLGDLGHPVASWAVVGIGETTCSVGRLLPGRPVAEGSDFSGDFAGSLGGLLGDLHRLPVDGFGPLADDENLKGASASIEAGIVDRWCHAPIWPFDDSCLTEHPLADRDPGVVRSIVSRRTEILAAGHGAIGLVHADLHRQHLLQDDAGGLSGVLDFGASFIGSIAWDFALLHWYYGAGNADRVAAAHPDGIAVSDSGRILALAVGLYKLAKSPSDPAVPRRLQRVLDGLA